MTRLRAEDLPLEVRRKLGIDAKASGRARPSRAGVGHAAPCPGRCVDCDAAFDRYSAFEKRDDRLRVGVAGRGHPDRGSDDVADLAALPWW